MHPDNPNVIYLSRQIEGVFEIERWETTDGGKTWSQEMITQNSEYDQVRPYIPRGLTKQDPEIVLLILEIPAAKNALFPLMMLSTIALVPKSSIPPPR